MQEPKKIPRYYKQEVDALLADKKFDRDYLKGMLERLLELEDFHQSVVQAREVRSSVATYDTSSAQEQRTWVRRANGVFASLVLHALRKVR